MHSNLIQQRLLLNKYTQMPLKKLRSKIKKNQKNKKTKALYILGSILEYTIYTTFTLAKAHFITT